MRIKLLLALVLLTYSGAVLIRPSDTIIHANNGTNVALSKREGESVGKKTAYLGNAVAMMALAVSFVADIMKGKLDDMSITTKLVVAKTNSAAGPYPVIYYKSTGATDHASLCATDGGLCMSCLGPGAVAVDKEVIPSSSTISTVRLSFGARDICFNSITIAFGPDLSPSGDAVSLTGDMLAFCSTNWRYNGLVDDEGRMGKCMYGKAGTIFSGMEFDPTALLAQFAKYKKEMSDYGKVELGSAKGMLVSICDIVSFVSDNSDYDGVVDTCSNDNVNAKIDVAKIANGVPHSTILLATQEKYYAKVTRYGNLCIYKGVDDPVLLEHKVWPHIWCANSRVAASPDDVGANTILRYDASGIHIFSNDAKVFTLHGSAGITGIDRIVVGNDGAVHFTDSNNNLKWKSTRDNGCLLDDEVYTRPYTSVDDCYYGSAIDFTTPTQIGSLALTARNSLRQDGIRYPTISLWSANNKVELRYAADGYLRLYNEAKYVVWSLAPPSSNGNKGFMVTATGGLCTYADTSKAADSTSPSRCHYNSDPLGGHVLVVLDNGFIEMYNSLGGRRWLAGGSNYFSPSNTLSSGERKAMDTPLISGNGLYHFYAHSLGGLAIRNTKTGKHISFLTESSPAGAKYSMELGSDGNLCVDAPSGGKRTCISGTSLPKDLYKLYMENNGIAYIYNTLGKIVWMSPQGPK